MIEAAKKTTYDEIPWGLRDLDKLVGTGYPGRLITIGARPSCGKSTFVLNWVNRLFGTGLDKENSALCFWTEHTREIAYTTWACMALGYDLDSVIKERWADLPPNAEAMVAEMTMGFEMDANIHFSPTMRPTGTQIQELVDQYQPRIVVYDYIQRIRPEKRQTKFDAISDAAILFRQLAIGDTAKGIPPRLVVVTSQLKRRGDGVFDKYRPPHMEDFKGAGEIEESANIALGLYRPLLPMTHKDEQEVRVGGGVVGGGLDRWQIPNCMAIKVLKHYFWPDASDKVVRVHCDKSVVSDWPGPRRQGMPPAGSGDAWEPGARDTDLDF